MCDNSCLLSGKDPKEHNKQMPAWIPIEGYLQKHSKSPPVCAVSYQSRCRKWDPWVEMLSALPRIHSHHSVSYLCWDNRSSLTAWGLNQTRLLSTSLSLSSQLCYRPLHFRAGPLRKKNPQKTKKQSICSGSCLKFNKCVSYIATVWC